jgi:DNA-binding MarR family transcriptional regulator
MNFADLESLFYLPLTVRQLGVLLAIHESSAPLMVRHLAQKMHVAKSAISRSFDMLCSVGFLTRVRDEEDQRNVFAILTDKGKSFVEGIVK